jgi:hypothetical protein
MALSLDTLETCAHTSETCEPSCTGRPARLFFMLEAHGTKGTIGRVAAPKPSRLGGRVQRRRTRSGARTLPSRGVRSEAIVHVVAPEPSLAEERGPEP